MIQVDLYTTPACAACHELKKLLDREKGIEVFVYDMTTPGAKSEALAAGMFELSLPVISINKGGFIPRRDLVDDEGNIKYEPLKKLFETMRSTNLYPAENFPGIGSTKTA